MKKKPYYLKFYKECMETGKIPNRGLCWCLGNPIPNPKDKCTVIFTNPDLMLFKPSDYSSGYWAAMDMHGADMCYSFTPIRQNIVLFLAAMNDEL